MDLWQLKYSARKKPLERLLSSIQALASGRFGTLTRP
jgi:hypothetical protein